MSSTIGTLTINIEAGVAKLQKDVAEAKGVVQDNLSQMSSAANLAKTALEALASAWAINEVKQWVGQSMDAIDANAKMADRLGITTESLAGMTMAAQLAGVTQETLATGMRKLSTSVYAASQGTGLAAKAFTTLHLSASSLMAMRPDEQLMTIVDALGKVENVTQRNALAQQIFGLRASEMLNLVSEGSAGIRKATEDATAWGLALNRVDSAKVEAANEAIIRAKGAFEGVANTLAVQLSPIIAAVANSFADAAAKQHGFSDAILTGMKYATEAVGYLADAVHVLHLGFLVMADGFAGVGNDIVQVIAWIDRSFTDFYNKIANSYIGQKLGLPMMQYTQGLQEQADISAKKIEALDASVVKLATAPWPHEQTDAWFKNVAAQAQKAAETVAKNRAALMGTGAVAGATTGGDGSGDADKLGQENAKYLAGLLQREDAIRKSLLTQKQAEDENYAQRKATLQAAIQYGVISQTQGASELEALEAAHNAKMEALDGGHQELTLSSASAFFGDLSNMMQTQSKAQFEIGKAASIAQTIIKTYESAVSSYAALAPIPYVGPFLAQAAFAAAIAVGMAQVSKIESTSFGSGSVSGGGGASIPTVASNPNTGLPVGTPGGNVGPTTQAQVVNVYLPSDGAPLSQDYVRNVLIPSLNEAQMDGATVLQVH